MSFHFDGYTVRPVDERDRAYLAQVIEADELHRGKMRPEDFLDLVQGEEAMACEDATGHVVVYFRTQTACRLAMLFPRPEEREQNRDALTKGLVWMLGALQQNRCRELLFDTDSLELDVFARRRLGFRKGREVLTHLIPQPDASGRARVPWEARNTPSGEEDEDVRTQQPANPN